MDKHQCPHCLKCFSTRQGKCKHVHNHCPIQKAKNEDDVKYTSIEIRAISKYLSNLLKSDAVQPAMVQNPVNITQNITTNNILVLNNFGNESITHLTKEFLDRCLEYHQKSIVNVIDNIHFNDEVPQNQNIKLIDQNSIGTYVNGLWERCDKNQVLDDLIKKSHKILYKHFLTIIKSDPSTPEQLHDFETYMSKLITKSNNEYYFIRHELFSVLEKWSQQKIPTI
jgi:hypothetical protein